MKLNRRQRDLIARACELIKLALHEGEVVRVPSFGKFYTGTVTCQEGVPEALGGEPTDDHQKFVQTVPRFRAYDDLKVSVRRRKFIT